MLYQLIKGELHENPRNIMNNSIIYCYSLDDLIRLRNPKALIRPAYEYEEKSEYYNVADGLSLYVSAFASNLKTYATEILKGDFTIFSEFNKIVKKRVENYKK